MTTELLQRAFEAYDQKNFAGSQALCEAFLSSNGDDPSALMLAGLIAKQQSRLEAGNTAAGALRAYCTNRKRIDEPCAMPLA
jgi:hypothetical protein